MLQVQDGTLTRLESRSVAAHTLTVPVKPENHEVYLPLQNVNGRSLLRIMKPALP